MLKKRSLLIAVLCISVIALLVTEGAARRGSFIATFDVNGGWGSWYIYVETLLRRLQNVSNTEHILYVSISGPTYEIRCINNGGKSFRASYKSVHLPDVLLETQIIIDPGTVDHNGTSTQEVVFGPARLDPPIEEYISENPDTCPNEKNWEVYREDGYIVYKIIEFDFELELWDEVNFSEHVIRGIATWNDRINDYDVEVTYDSQA